MISNTGSIEPRCWTYVVVLPRILLPHGRFGVLIWSHSHRLFSWLFQNVSRLFLNLFWFSAHTISSDKLLHVCAIHFHLQMSSFALCGKILQICFISSDSLIQLACNMSYSLFFLQKHSSLFLAHNRRCIYSWCKISHYNTAESRRKIRREELLHEDKKKYA